MKKLGDKSTYIIVKIGDIIAPYCAAREGGDRSPFVVGERQRIHIPHQHIILWWLRPQATLCSDCHLLSKIRWMTRPRPEALLFEMVHQEIWQRDNCRNYIGWVSFRNRSASLVVILVKFRSGEMKSDLNLTFCASAMDSMAKPVAQMTIPAISREVPNLGSEPPIAISDTAGELRIVRGRETVHVFPQGQCHGGLYQEWQDKPRASGLEKKNCQLLVLIL